MTTNQTMNNDRIKLEKKLLKKIEKKGLFSWSGLKAVITLDSLMHSA